MWSERTSEKGHAPNPPTESQVLTAVADPSCCGTEPGVWLGKLAAALEELQQDGFHLEVRDGSRPATPPVLVVVRKSP